KRTECKVDGCRKFIRGKRLCGMHGERLRKYGSTDPPVVLTPLERFDRYVDRTAGPEGCHPWTGLRDPDGYGIFHGGKGSTRRPHRWILGHSRGAALRRDELALHHCDNPPCVNPAHLYVGDAKQNMQDKIDRGRVRTIADRTHCRNGHEY